MTASRSTPDIASTRRQMMATIKNSRAAARPVRARSSQAPGREPADAELWGACAGVEGDCLPADHAQPQRVSAAQSPTHS